MVVTRTAKLGTHTSTGTREQYTLFICPAGYRTIFKTLYSIAVTGPAAVQAMVYDQVTSTLVHVVLETIEALTPLAWEGWVILEEGDQLVVYADRPDVRFWASGTLLPV